MWNGLFFGLVSLFTPHADLPEPQTVQNQIEQFAQVYALDTTRIHVQQSTLKNPSPFLTKSSAKSCVLHINDHPDAKRVWSLFLNSGETNTEAAFLAFTSAHELTHCLMAEPGKRVSARASLEKHLGMQFKNTVHFEETLADLVGLAYVQQVAPEHFDVILKRLKNIRTDFSNRDPDHNSSAAITIESIQFADQLLNKATPVRLAAGSAP